MVKMIPVYLMVMSLLAACAARDPAPPDPVGDDSRYDMDEVTRIVLLDPDRVAEEREMRMLRAGEGQQRTLSAAETGYYMDVLEARMRQALRRWEVSVVRDGRALVLTVPAVLAFDTGSATLLQGAAGLMEAVGDLLHEFESVFVTIHGHTDRLGPADVNLRLSEQRALAMGHFLLDTGVAGDRLAAVGHGETLPLAAVAGGENELRNRRMEIRLEPLIRPSRRPNTSNAGSD